MFLSFRRFRGSDGRQRSGLKHPACCCRQRGWSESYHHSNGPARQPADYWRDVAAVLCHNAARTAEYGSDSNASHQTPSSPEVVLLLSVCFIFSAGGARQHSDRGGGDGGASASTLQKEEAGGNQQPQRLRRNGEWSSFTYQEQ